MDLSYFLTADYANITQDGKLNVMGIFSSINAYRFPAVHRQMYLVAQLTAGPFEYGRSCEVMIRLIDEDASELLNFNVSVDVPAGDQGQIVHVNLFWRLDNVQFSRPGRHVFGILVDNDTKGELIIEVNQLPQPKED
jgi:hypothetical protein